MFTSCKKTSAIAAALLSLFIWAAASLPAFAVTGEEIVLEAEKYLGAPYGWSAAGPDAFDCGGFTWYVYDQLGVDFGLRIESSELADQWPVVENAAELQMGDIVFCGYGRDSIGHWGIYSGYGHIIHSYNSGTGVVETLLDEVSPPFCYGVRLPGATEYEPQKALSGLPSLWAAAEVQLAIGAGLVDETRQGGYQQDMSRGEFCSLLINLCETAFDREAHILLAERGLSIDHDAFSDTRNEDILTAHALGLVNGKGDGAFAPDEPLRRQEAAMLLVRALDLSGKAKQFGIKLEDVYSDLAGVSAWAPPRIGLNVSALDPVSGAAFVSGFSAVGGEEHYTREQAYISAMRLYNLLIAPEDSPAATYLWG